MVPKFVELLKRIKPEIVEKSDINLIEAGILGSLDVMNLVYELETQFEIELEPDDIIPANFSSAQNIWGFVEKYLKDKKSI